MRSAVAIAAVLASSPALAATPVPLSVPAAVAVPAPDDVADRGCAISRAAWNGRYLTRDGHAVRVTWSIATRFECDNPEFHLDVHGQLLRDGRLVSGVDAAGSCDAKVAAGCTEVAGTATRALTGRLSGLWQLRLTVHVRGADAAVMGGDGCRYDPATVTLTCEATSRPVRLP